MNSFLIRNAKTSDLTKLVEFRLSLQKHAEKSNPRIWRVTKEGEALLKQNQEKALRDSNNRMVVAEMSGEVIGFAQGEILHRTEYLPESVGMISFIYVAKGFRRRGVGSRLVEKLCRFFLEEKAEHITLRYIIGNVEAEGFWSKLRFEPVIKTVSTRPEELKECLVQK